MALQLGALRDALLAANVPSEKASAAAEEIAGYDNRLASMDARLSVLTWMVATNLMLTAGVLWRLLSHT
jgi:hypothetical protein